MVQYVNLTGWLGMFAEKAEHSCEVMQADANVRQESNFLG